jgi:hypothetical protein
VERRNAGGSVLTDGILGGGGLKVRVAMLENGTVKDGMVGDGALKGDAEG